MSEYVDYRPPPEERFWRDTVKTPDCWLWSGTVLPNGYGKISIKHRLVSVHRYSYELHHGEIPEGMYVLHHCDVRHCVRPDHLFLGDHRANMQDMVEKKRSAHGERHPNGKLTEEDVLAIYEDPRPSRVVAAESGMSKSAVLSIRRGRTWSWLTGASAIH